MQNRKIYLGILLAASLFSGQVMAQSKKNDAAAAAPVDPLSDFSSEMAQKKTVDFPPRSSLDSIELAPLPGIYETNINGPQPMAESVSINDMPSEQLLGRLTPEVFQEMAELERDNAFLKLQIQKESMKNDLENLRSNYRQARLDEIAKREEVVRSRIQWWQEQEKLRQEMEKERAAAEEVKNQLAETEALKAQLEAAAAAITTPAQNDTEKETEASEEVAEEQPAISVSDIYVLLDVKGTRGNLSARVKNTTTEEITTLKIGDTLAGENVIKISSESVILESNGTEHTIKFPVAAAEKK